MKITALELRELSKALGDTHLGEFIDHCFKTMMDQCAAEVFQSDLDERRLRLIQQQGAAILRVQEFLAGIHEVRKLSKSNLLEYATFYGVELIELNADFTEEDDDAES